MTLHKKSSEMRAQICNLAFHVGLSPKEISSRLNVPTKRVYYHLRRETKDSPETTKIRADLADALTREKFYKDLVERLSRRLLWKTELRQPIPIIKRDDR
jgi:transposase